MFSRRRADRPASGLVSSELTQPCTHASSGRLCHSPLASQSRSRSWDANSWQRPNIQSRRHRDTCHPPGLAWTQWTLLGSFLHDTCGAGAGGRLGLTGDNPLSQVAGARAQAREHWDSGPQAVTLLRHPPIGAGMCPNAGPCSKLSNFMRVLDDKTVGLDVFSSV